MNKKEYLNEVDAAWGELNAMIAPLSEQQWTSPRDAAGWRVQDHIAHLASWESTKIAVLQGQTRDSALGMPIGNDDFFTINEHLRKRTAHLSTTETRALFEETHARFLSLVQAVPAEYFEASINQTYPNNGMSLPDAVPLWEVLAGDTFEHFREHIPWIQAILKNS